MTDLSQMSDAELLAIYAMPGLIKRESGGRAGVLGPQTKYGQAQGMTQMLPATAQMTARKIGVDWRPELMTGTDDEAAAYQQLLGEAYLREGIEATGSLEDGLRYYHGGPNKKLWGPKTEDYATSIVAGLGDGFRAPTGGPGRDGASELSELTDEQLLELYGETQPAPPPAPASAPKRVGSSRSGGVTIDVLPPEKPAQRASQTLGFVMGATDPLINVGKRLSAPLPGDDMIPASMRAARNVMGMLGPVGALKLLAPQVEGRRDVLIEDAARKGVRPGKIGEFAGNVASLAAIPGGPIVSGAASGAALSQAETPLGVGRDIVIGGAAGKVADIAVKGVGKLVSNLLSKSPKVLKPAEINAAREAAYRAVDDMGVQYTPQSMDDLVVGMTDEMAAAKINPLRHPKAASMLDEIQNLRGQSPTLTQLDQLRQVIRRDVASASDPAEAFFGQKMIKNLDEFIDAAGPDQVVAGDAARAAATIKNARALNTQLRKIESVEEAVVRAADRTASTGGGGNIDNAIRQNLRRFKETTKNLTPDERRALQRVIDGSPGQNLARQVGKLSPQSSGLMTALGIGGTMANPILGIPALIGAGSKTYADAATRKNVENLTRIMAAGGTRKAAEKTPTAASRAVDALVPLLRPAAAPAGAALGVALLPPASKRRQKRR